MIHQDCIARAPAGCRAYISPASWSRARRWTPVAVGRVRVCVPPSPFSPCTLQHSPIDTASFHTPTSIQVTNIISSYQRQRRRPRARWRAGGRGRGAGQGADPLDGGGSMNQPPRASVRLARLRPVGGRLRGIGGRALLAGSPRSRPPFHLPPPLTPHPSHDPKSFHLTPIDQLYGLLFTLSRERWDFNRHWVAARLLLEHIQIAVFVLQPQFLWALPYDKA
jgi:hypothetical protein